MNTGGVGYLPPFPPTVLHITNYATDKTITLIVKSCDTIESTKAMVQEKEGTLANRQRLVFNGRELEDGHTLSDYNIQGEAALGLMSRQGMDILTPLLA